MQLGACQSVMSLYTINHGPCAMRSFFDSKMYLFNVSQCLTLSEPPEGHWALAALGLARAQCQGIAREVPEKCQGIFAKGSGGRAQISQETPRTH